LTIVPFESVKPKRSPEGPDQTIRGQHLKRTWTTHHVPKRRTIPVRCLYMIGKKPFDDLGTLGADMAMGTMFRHRLKIMHPWRAAKPTDITLSMASPEGLTITGRQLAAVGTVKSKTTLQISDPFLIPDDDGLKLLNACIPLVQVVFQLLDILAHGGNITGKT